MCGICGEFRFDGGSVDRSVIERMSDRLEPRGPDGSGVFLEGPVGLGHRRLKIIDLSEQSAQPMIDEELGIALVYNGAIYNYQELRSELEQDGYRFSSSGDTEVLIKAYRKWGEDFVTRLNGMFAFALYDRKEQTVLLGRDRLGIKPLYFSQTNSRIRFASSLPALLAAGEVSSEINPVALHHYFSFHAVVPPPHTILRDVQKLPPATTAQGTTGGMKAPKKYWEPHFGEREGESRSFEDWRSVVLEELRAAVRRRCVADVSVGVLLSGGLDSSLIVGLLAEQGQSGINTFSVGFESVEEEKGDEFEYSDIIASEFQTEHHKLTISAEKLLTHLPSCIAAMSEPMVSHDNIGFYLLSEEVSRHVKVVQSGQGADEVFAGYHWYPPLLESSDPVGDYAKVFFDRDHAQMKELLEESFIREDFSRTLVEEQFATPYATRAIDKALRLDTLTMLVDDPVKRVDNMTMAFGLEARVPFLDHTLVEVAARVPAEWKVREGGKYILKEAARSVIPSEVIDRPKGYFPVPVLKYFRGPYLEMVRETLLSDTARARKICKTEYVDKVLSDPDAYITPLKGSELWQITLLELWFQQHGITH